MFKFLKKNKVLLNLINSLPDKNLITLMDVGAADGLSNTWKQISTNIHYIAFEPDERSDTDNNIHNFGKIEIFRKAVWNSNDPIHFNLTKKEQNSSCYKPNYNFLQNFPNVQRFEIVEILDVIPIKISDLKLNNIDFIKLDIQGGELNVLKGTGNILFNTIGLEIEVEFLELYKNQPIFGDLINYLKDYNFEFFDFTTLTKWERDNIQSELGQCIFADALFLKTPEDIVKNSITNNNIYITKYIIICLIYNKLDLIIVLKNHLDFVKNNNYTVFFKHFLKYRNRINYKNKFINKTNKFVNNIFNILYK